MNHVFVKEEEQQWLHEVSPTVNALISYLMRRNNGVKIYERTNYFDSITGNEVHEMSNGLCYTKDKDNKWMIVGSL